MMRSAFSNFLCSLLLPRTTDDSFARKTGSAHCAARAARCPSVMPFLPRRPFRPLAFMSSMLSFCVPRNICAGLQHAGLSQRCRTLMPVGTSPCAAIQAAWCAFVICPLCLMIPYPKGVRAPRNSQQPSVISALSNTRHASEQCDQRGFGGMNVLAQRRHTRGASI